LSANDPPSDAWRTNLRADVADAALDTVKTALVEAAANGASIDETVWRAFAVLHTLLHGRDIPQTAQQRAAGLRRKSND
jgi:hypothetical protein